MSRSKLRVDQAIYQDLYCLTVAHHLSHIYLCPGPAYWSLYEYISISINESTYMPSPILNKWQNKAEEMESQIVSVAVEGMNGNKIAIDE